MICNLCRKQVMVYYGLYCLPCVGLIDWWMNTDRGMDAGRCDG